MDITILIISTPILIYIAIWLSVRIYIKNVITSKKKRIDFKKENDINEVVSDVFKPVAVLAMVLVLLLKISNIFEINVKTITSTVYILYFIVSVGLSIISFKRLMIILKSAKDY